jgi:hypothetical protein
MKEEKGDDGFNEAKANATQSDKRKRREENGNTLVFFFTSLLLANFATLSATAIRAPLS